MIKKLFVYLVGFICLFVVLGAKTTFAACNINDPAVRALKDSCDTSAGKYFDYGTCRCQNTKGAENVRDQYGKCRDIVDDAQRRACQENLAKDAVGSDNLDNDFDPDTGLGEAKKWVDFGASTITAFNLGTAIMALAGSDPEAGSCISKYLFAGASIAYFGGEVYVHFFVLNKLRDLKKSYREEFACQNEKGESLEGDSLTGCLAKGKDPMETQKKAFDFLHDEQEIIGDAANTKFILHTIAGVAYAAAAVFGYYENASPTATKCIASTSYNNPGSLNNLFISMDENEQNIFKHEISLLTLNQKYNPRSDFASNFFELLEKQQSTAATIYQAPKLEEYYQFQNELNQLTNDSPRIAAETFNYIQSLLISSAKAQGKGYNSDKGLESVNANPDKSSSGLLKTNQSNDAEGFIPSNPVETTSMWTSLIVGGGALLLNQIKPVRQALGSSLGIAIMSTISALSHGFLAVASKMQSDQAKDNAAKIDAVRKEFMASIGNYCPKGREDLSDPQCYCMLEGGKGKNPSRTESDVCQAFWKAMEANYYIPPEEIADGGDNNIIGCMTVNRTFDQDCQCKKFIDKKTGKNACYSVPLGSGQIGALGAGMGLGSTLNDLSKVTNGNLNGGNVNVNDLKNRAKRSGQMMHEMIKKTNDQRGKKKQNPLGPFDTASALAYAKKIVPPSDLKSALAKGHLSGSSESSAAKNPLMAKALEEIKNPKKMVVSGGTGFQAQKKKANSSDDDLSLDLSQANQTSGEIGHMDKKYNFKDNDIVNNEDASIWQVITNRYNQTGYTRLFDDGKEEDQVVK